VSYENYEPTQEELDDAIVEDTCHCDVCGASFVLGGPDDHVLIEIPQIGGTVATGKFCVECAEKIHEEFLKLQ
jgi:hypothetical protein